LSDASFLYLVIPLGLIRDAYFTRNVPKYLNIGSLGLTLAHEILHSIDRTGRGFQGDGKLQVYLHWFFLFHPLIEVSQFYKVLPNTFISPCVLAKKLTTIFLKFSSLGLFNTLEIPFSCRIGGMPIPKRTFPMCQSVSYSSIKNISEDLWGLMLEAFWSKYV